MKIIIGAGGTEQLGWRSLERSQLDIRDRAQWAQLFAPNSLEAVLTEHVLEHLTSAEANAAARNVYEFLAPGCHWRIAVPDANNPDPIYQDMCKPGGVERSKYDFLLRLLHGADAPGHKEHYNLESLAALLRASQFDVEPLEWYDSLGRFRRAEWDAANGVIRRSPSSPSSLVWHSLFTGCWNTSLIVDAIKPALFLEYRQLWRGDPDYSEVYSS